MAQDGLAALTRWLISHFDDFLTAKDLSQAVLQAVHMHTLNRQRLAF